MVLIESPVFHYCLEDHLASGPLVLAKLYGLRSLLLLWLLWVGRG